MADQNSGDFRITTGVLYSKLEEQSRQIGSLENQISLMGQSLQTILTENVKDKSRIEKLENRMNGVFTGIGVGIVTALIAVFRGVIG